mmetsp:Transcript_25029/g.62938  ORF Transcript_25029/g.62938 Transcript_25029/m.62938 type:complete len:100 (-) Transcript_25029:403-702(-)
MVVALTLALGGNYTVEGVLVAPPKSVPIGQVDVNACAVFTDDVCKQLGEAASRGDKWRKKQGAKVGQNTAMNIGQKAVNGQLSDKEVLNYCCEEKGSSC